MSCALLAIGRTLNLLLQHLIKKVVAIAEDFFFTFLQIHSNVVLMYLLFIFLCAY